MKHTRTPETGQAPFYHTIQLRPGVGVRVVTEPVAKRIMPQPECLQGTKRGPVKGMTRESANRLRNLLFPLDYGNAFGIALTAPPWVTERPETAFDVLSKTKSRCKGLRALIWRKEVTAKGMPHYHAIAFLEDGSDFRTFQRVQLWLVDQWARALLPRLCPVRARLASSSKWIPGDTEAGRRMIRDVNLRAENLTLITSANAVQYLCDHTSKHKAYQAKTVGRPWGVWFKARLPVIRIPHHDLAALPGRVVRRVQQALGKMSRYWFRDDSRPFGYRWSHERRFAGQGRRVLFKPAAAAAISRLVDFELAALSPS